METYNLLLHLPEKGKREQSSTQHIEAYCSLVATQGYAWLCKPGRSLDADLRQEIEQALHYGNRVSLFLFVRENLEERRLALYRARLLDVQGPGPNADADHLLLGLQGKGCGTWFKIADVTPLEADYYLHFYDARTGEPVPVWTDLNADLYTVTEGEAFIPQPPPEVKAWLLCLNQKRARDEFERAWRFRPVATHQPGSGEFIRAYQNGEPLVILAYDRVFGSPTYLELLGLYDMAELIPQGVQAGALVYTLQLREGARYNKPLTLNPRQPDSLWDALHIDAQDWESLTSGERALLALSVEDYAHILDQGGVQVETAQPPVLLPKRKSEKLGIVPVAAEDTLPELRESLAQLSTVMAPAEAITEKECYSLMRVLERALRDFIQRELVKVDANWWDSGRVLPTIRTRALERKQKREHPFPWMSQQDLPVQEYLDFSDYAEIITAARNWNEVFAAIFLQPEVIRGKLIELSIFRNDIAHMRPLQAGDKAVFLAYAWQVLGMIEERIFICTDLSKQ